MFRPTGATPNHAGSWQAHPGWQSRCAPTARHGADTRWRCWGAPHYTRGCTHGVHYERRCWHTGRCLVALHESSNAGKAVETHTGDKQPGGGCSRLCASAGGRGAGPPCITLGNRWLAGATVAATNTPKALRHHMPSTKRCRNATSQQSCLHLTAGRSRPRAAAGVHSSSVVLLSRKLCRALMGSVPSGSSTAVVQEGANRASGARGQDQQADLVGRLCSGYANRRGRLEGQRTIQPFQTELRATLTPRRAAALPARHHTFSLRHAEHTTRAPCSSRSTACTKPCNSSQQAQLAAGGPGWRRAEHPPEILWSPHSTVRSGPASCRACSSLPANTMTRAGASSAFCLRPGGGGRGRHKAMGAGRVHSSAQSLPTNTSTHILMTKTVGAFGRAAPGGGLALSPFLMQPCRACREPTVHNAHPVAAG